MNETDTTLRRCAGTPELSCHEELAGEHRNRVRCHRCSVEYNNARRPRAAGRHAIRRAEGAA